MMMITMMMRRRKRSPHLMMTRLPPVRQTPTHQQGGDPAAVGNLSRAPLSLRPQVRSPPQGEFGTADEPPRQAAGEHSSPSEAGKHHQELSPPAARAVPQAAASPHAWSCPRPYTASPLGPSCPHLADMSHLPLREDHLPSDPFLLFVPSLPAATGQHKLGPLPCLLGCTGPLDICPGRALVHRAVMSHQ